MMDVEAFHDEKAVGNVYDVQLLRRLIRYLKPHRWMAAGALALILLSSLLQLVGPLAVAVVLDLYIMPQTDPDAAAPTAASRWVETRLDAAGIHLEPVTGVTVLAVFYLVVILLTFGVLFLQSYVMQLMGQFVMYDLRQQIFARLQRLPVSYFDRNPIGRLVTRATTDVGALNEMFTAGLVSVFGDVMLLAGIVAVLFWLNWKLALVSFAIVPLLLLLTLWFKSRARQSYRTVRVKIARINAFLQEHITGISVVQLFNREQRAGDEFAAINDDHRQANVQAILYYAFYYPAVELITALGLALIVWYGGGQVLRGVVSIGALVAFLQYAQRFYRPLADLAEKYNILQGAMASSERIFELIDAEETVVSPPDGYRPAVMGGAVRFDGVSFSYKPGEPVLRSVSFDIPAGETVAVVGHTGAGKSTLANLLLRFYDADEGSVSVDGVDVRQWDLQALRGGIAMVLQDVFLRSGDVASNIRLGAAAIDDAQMRRAAQEVHALGFIERLPEGFSTPVGEGGAGLSVGQKQLIAFARALAFEPRILILDEATASIDTETEQRIQAALERLLVGRTSLVIAHRLSTIQKADRILVLHKGELREQGTHQELMACGGIYQKLVQLQHPELRESLAAGG